MGYPQFACIMYVHTSPKLMQLDYFLNFWKLCVSKQKYRRHSDSNVVLIHKLTSRSTADSHCNIIGGVQHIQTSWAVHPQ